MDYLRYYDVLHWLCKQCRDKHPDIFTLHMRIVAQITDRNPEWFHVLYRTVILGIQNVIMFVLFHSCSFVSDNIQMITIYRHWHLYIVVFRWRSYKPNMATIVYFSMANSSDLSLPATRQVAAQSPTQHLLLTN